MCNCATRRAPEPAPPAEPEALVASAEQPSADAAFEALAAEVEATASQR